MTIPEIIGAARKLELNGRNSEVQELAGLVRQLASEANESLEFLTKTKADVPERDSVSDFHPTLL